MNRRSAANGQAATTAAVFGEVLRHLRDKADLTQDELAGRIPCDRSLIARIESGTRVPQAAFADTCDRLLAAQGMLTRLWHRIDWYPQVEHPDWFRRRAEMDAVAVALREYQNQVMPGLLQTEEYARALFSRVAGVTAEESEERVRARMSRQQRFLRPDGPLLVVVLDESAIRNAVGGTATMCNQLGHLLDVRALPNICIQVVPCDNPAAIRPNTSMSLISLPGKESWLYSESLDRGHFSNDPATLARHSRTYDVLRGEALSARDSAALISDLREGLRHGESAPPHVHVDQEQLQRRQRRQLRRGGPRYPRLRARP
ncbi:helix-turn-helix transcriptional regulator [Streptomyces sp. 549]|uniref:helix-turn-helix domain-containing protein n=1 Tax=Streptomyces sp. 549 TaxID=3049076 RepID=UPI0024C46942|nr:helix-turn-helix transcriptional regulator [Streptomyces sp. 549]MDK1473205.1 helix-turn-helix transcriptional regulator [Streptomyces sp. 549]